MVWIRHRRPRKLCSRWIKWMISGLRTLVMRYIQCKTIQTLDVSNIIYI